MRYDPNLRIECGMTGRVFLDTVSQSGMTVKAPRRGYGARKDTKTKRSVTARLPTFLSVRDEIRTHTSQRPLPPQSSVSTNSTTRTYGISSLILVPRTGLEPACLSTHAPETCASTNSATWAFCCSSIEIPMELKSGLEHEHQTLARLCSTN